MRKSLLTVSTNRRFRFDSEGDSCFSSRFGCSAMNLEDLCTLLLRDDLSFVRVCDIEPALAEAIGAETREVLLSRLTIEKQLREHKDIGSTQYSLLAAALVRGMAVLNDDRPHTAQICFQHPRDEKKRYRVFIKRTGDRRRIFVDSFHRTSPGQTKSVLRRGRLIRQHR